MTECVPSTMVFSFFGDESVHQEAHLPHHHRVLRAAEIKGKKSQQRTAFLGAGNWTTVSTSSAYQHHYRFHGSTFESPCFFLRVYTLTPVSHKFVITKCGRNSQISDGISLLFRPRNIRKSLDRDRNLSKYFNAFFLSWHRSQFVIITAPLFIHVSSIHFPNIAQAAQFSLEKVTVPLTSLGCFSSQARFTAICNKSVCAMFASSC